MIKVKTNTVIYLQKKIKTTKFNQDDVDLYIANLRVDHNLFLKKPTFYIKRYERICKYLTIL